MSAYMVTKTHINALVWLATRPGRHVLEDAPSHKHEGRMTIDEREIAIGKLLIEENHASVAYNYPNARELPGGPVDAQAYRYTAPRRFPTTIEAIKIVDHYTYQAGDHPTWEQSWAFKFCQALKSDLITELPGYQQAPWGWDDTPEEGHGPSVSLYDLARSKGRR